VIVERLRAAGCVYAEDEARLLEDAAQSPAELEAMVAQRVEGRPLEQILGWAEFAGLRVAVAPGVFVPRRRTRLLVRAALGLIRPGSVVVDLCCGSGAVAAALAAQGPAIELYAADLAPAAVACARVNLTSRGGRVFQGDLFDPLPAEIRGRVDVVVANAPYVPTDEIALMPPEARVHEPRAALDGGGDGVDLHRRIAAESRGWLAPTGHLLIETSQRQASTTENALRVNGFSARVVVDDDLSATVVVATVP
jgi:release factor glutamine methyltransferase